MSSECIGSLGVMVCRRKGSPPFADSSFLRKLCQASSAYGIRAFVFTPAPLPLLGAEHKGTQEISVSGYTCSKEGWISGSFPMPDIIYDRCLFLNKEEAGAAASFISILDAKQTILWSRSLPGKQKVYRCLMREPWLMPHIPHTLTYAGSQSVLEALKLFDGKLFMKPSGGSHGSHTVQISTTGSKSVLKGRTRHNQIFHARLPVQELPAWIKNFTGERNFLIQPYLELTNQEGSPFDMRVLVQKNSRGLWTLTGSAIRVGSSEGNTSNLHGGGTAVSALPFLTSEFGSVKAYEIINTASLLAEQIPPLLENGFGRLGELGIDFGIDRTGKVWLLEVNSKPGRRAFQLTGDRPAALLSVEHPLQYARYLLLRQLRRVNT